MREGLDYMLAWVFTLILCHNRSTPYPNSRQSIWYDEQGGQWSRTEAHAESDEIMEYSLGQVRDST
jgi:hypothetical protein